MNDFPMITSYFSKTFHTFLCLAVLTLSASFLEASRAKQAITKSKVTGSIFDIIDQNTGLEQENARLRARETSQWLVINQTRQPLVLTTEGTSTAMQIAAQSTFETTLESVTAFKPGDTLNLAIPGQGHTQLTLEAGKTTMLDGGKSVTIDFLSGSGAWLVLIR